MTVYHGGDIDAVSIEKRAAAAAAGSPAPRRSNIPRTRTRHVAAAHAWKTSVRRLYRRFVLELLLRRRALPPSQDGRHIPLRLADGDGQPLIDERRGHPFVSNAIRTSRYTVYDFLPKQILFQFSRLANFYFLCVGVPQTIPGLSTTGNYTTILPLLFFVLLTVVKEGYDDWKRHRLDKVENARIAFALRRRGEGDSLSAGRRRFLRLPPRWVPLGRQRPRPEAASAARDAEEPSESGFQWTATRWRDLRVGDVIKLSRDDDVPADVVLLHADGENGLAYIETMALDGETNLKSKQVSPAIEGCDTIDGIVRCSAEFVVEDPNPNLYRFDGRVTVDGTTTRPLTLSEVIYRGSTLRNTARAVGLVINTGEECKIRRNANRHPSAKKPALERIANRVVVTLAVYVVVLSVGCSMGYLLWRQSTERRSWYLADASVAFQEIIIGYAIQFNNVIPLALYVSLEIVKLGQMLMLNSDLDMYDEVSDTPARCNTNTILENLGQVGYVFSDKTGTLTENVMKFRKMSIAGTAWLHDADLAEETTTSDAMPDAADVRLAADGKGKEVVVVEAAVAPSQPAPARTRRSLGDEMRVANDLSLVPSRATSLARRSSSHWRSSARPDHVQPDLTTTDLLEYVRLRPDSPFARRAVQYILALAVCHTCLPETKDGRLEYQAASPDELALVRAARELGFVVAQRSTRSLTLRIRGPDGAVQHRIYDILDVIEFSSKRKKMSVVVRCPDGRIWFVCKGADSAILPRLKMAHLAMQKANEVRQSLEVEQELLRQSEAREPRNSFGGRPSLTLKRGLGRQAGTAGPSRTSSSAAASRSKSFEISRATKSEDRLRPRISVRTVSLDVAHRHLLLQPQSSSQAAAREAAAMPSKFSFLEDASLYDDAQIFTRCFQHLDDFATEGLRTLLFAHKYIPEHEYRRWKTVFDEATTSLVDREERIDAAADQIEQSLELIGATAIEDKLQKGVPETIDRLRRANIKIWMLTGDKRETAINIAHSARVCLPTSDVFVLDVAKGDLEAQLLGIVEDLQPLGGGSSSRSSDASPPWGTGVANHSVVVVDGHTLSTIDQPGQTRLQSLFYSLIPTVDSVICCRASPAQKALLVRAIRKTSAAATGTHAIVRTRSDSPPWWRGLRLPSLMAGSRRRTTRLTLAIGDGANDLAMLAEAHVGVGVSGKEGLQAARVADYSVAQFRFLARLLLVHGRWNYMRTARFVLATFWKEMFFYLPTALYQRYNGYTGTSLYENWSLTVLNTLFTSLCVIVPGIFEQDLAAETLLAVPELYVFGQRDEGLNALKYVGWMAGAAAEGLVVWFACWAGYGRVSQVRDQGLFALGDLVFSVAIMWTNLKLLILDAHYKTAVVLVSYAVTASGWWAWNGFLSSVYADVVTPYAVRHGFATTFGREPAWWLTLVLVLGVLVTAELGYRAVKRNLIVTGLWKWGWKWLSWSTWKRAFASVVRGSKRAGGEGKVEALGRRNVEEWGVEMWQEMEREPSVRAMLRKMSRLVDEGEEEPGGDEDELDIDVARGTHDV